MYCTSETNNKIKFFLKKFIKMLPVVRSGCYVFFSPYDSKKFV